MSDAATPPPEDPPPGAPSGPDGAGAPGGDDDATGAARRRREEAEAALRQRRAELLARERDLTARYGLEVPGGAVASEGGNELLQRSCSYFNRHFGIRHGSGVCIRDGVIRWHGELTQAKVLKIIELANEVGWRGTLFFTAADGRNPNPRAAVAFNQKLHDLRFGTHPRFTFQGMLGLGASKITNTTFRAMEAANGGPLFSASLEKCPNHLRSAHRQNATWGERIGGLNYRTKTRIGGWLSGLFSRAADSEYAQRVAAQRRAAKERQNAAQELRDIRRELADLASFAPGLAS